MKNSRIFWTDHTFNGWIGCTKVSPGCANCYAETWGKRFGVAWGPGGPRKRTSAAYWRQPLAWDRAGPVCVDCGTPIRNDGTAIDCACGQLGAIGKSRRPRVFCGSLCDWLDYEVPVKWLADLLDLIRRTQNLDWQLLTKRPEIWRFRITESRLYAAGQKQHDLSAWLSGWIADSTPPSNVWIGTTVEDQQRADERIPHLLRIPAKVRFLSCESLLGPVCIDEAMPPRGEEGSGPNIHWVICGGESGPKARPMHPEWARSLRDQCAAAGVPFFFKQWGGLHPVQCPEFDGRIHDAFPTESVWGRGARVRHGGTGRRIL